MAETILLVDDDPDILALCAMYLEDLGRVLTAADGLEALALFRKEPVSLAVIDVMMPQMNGYQLVAELRRVNSRLPILLLTARTRLEDKVIGFQLGADDYLCKPFEPQELRLRAEALLRRASAAPADGDPLIVIGNVALDVPACVVRVDGQAQALTATEARLLKALMEARGRILSLERLYEIGWQEAGPVNDNAIRVAINKLRAKVGGEAIRTIRGVGYRWENADVTR